MKIGSLFSGIGGLELGLERAGLGRTVWQVENNDFCRRVLAKHWPDVDRSVRDVKEAGSGNLSPVDLVCGGFPCQPFSTAARGRNNAEDLWPEMLRVVSEIRPRFVVAENVQFDPIALAADDLCKLGYQTIPFALSASLVGADHDRIRWFLVADADGKSKPRIPEYVQVARVSNLSADEPEWAHARGVGDPDGIPDRMDRLCALGNAVVPQCAEVVGQVIREIALG